MELLHTCLRMRTAPAHCHTPPLPSEDRGMSTGMDMYDMAAFTELLHRPDVVTVPDELYGGCMQLVGPSGIKCPRLRYSHVE